MSATNSFMRGRCFEVFLKMLNSPEFQADFMERCSDSPVIADSELAQMDDQSMAFLHDVISWVEDH